MFQRLKKKWGLNWWGFTLVFCTFALGGSLCGYAGRKLLMLIELDRGFLYYLAYLLLVTLLWPLAVIVVSIPLGQFTFFSNYLKKIWNRISGNKQKDLRIAIFASGAGTNAANIIRHFKKHKTIRISLIVCNKPGAGAIKVAADAGIPVLLIEKESFFHTDACLHSLKKHKIDFIVLAGFLWKIPVNLIEAFSKKIINIHPALLPKYGGKGMYGMKVHEAVVAAGEKESGITIHYVNEHYDEGAIIFQEKCAIESNDTPIILAEKVHALEYKHFPSEIENTVLKRPQH